MLVAVLAALAIGILRPSGPGAPAPVKAFASDVRRVSDRMGPPPSREDLIGAICTRYLAGATCVHELMALYRVCGSDAAHPRTSRCAAEVARVRRRSAK